MGDGFAEDLQSPEIKEDLPDQEKDEDNATKEEKPSEDERLSEDEEKKVLEICENYKMQGNKAFKEDLDFKTALELYTKSVETCPGYLHEPLSVYWGNIAACHFNLKDYEEAVNACTKSLEYNPEYMKVRTRRASANESIGTLASLQVCIDDYKVIYDKISGTEKSKIEKKIRELETLRDVKQKKETDEMLAKLKDMGNGLLGKFGLSLDNFKMTPNGEGGYSMSM